MICKKFPRFTNINYFSRFTVILAAVFCIAACSQHTQNDYTKSPVKILFIGNSLTHYNGGLDYMLKKMFAQSNPQMKIYSEKIAPGGERLSGHYKKGKVLQKIKETKWDIIVLQEYSNGPIVNKEDFYKYSKLLVKEIRKSGANAVFYMTFGYKGNPEMTPLLINSYSSVCKELHCELVPVGVAWSKVMNAKPDYIMYSDFKHPSALGTYLISCMFYSYLTGMHPSNSRYINGLDHQQAMYIQDVAWQTVSEWKKSNGK